MKVRVHRLVGQYEKDRATLLFHQESGVHVGTITFYLDDDPPNLRTVFENPTGAMTVPEAIEMANDIMEVAAIATLAERWLGHLTLDEMLAKIKEEQEFGTGLLDAGWEGKGRPLRGGGT